MRKVKIRERTKILRYHPEQCDISHSEERSLASRRLDARHGEHEMVGALRKRYSALLAAVNTQTTRERLRGLLATRLPVDHELSTEHLLSFSMLRRH
jgi:hypothetical protein